MGMFNPWVLLAIVLAFASATSVAGYEGYQFGKNAIIASNAAAVKKQEDQTAKVEANLTQKAEDFVKKQQDQQTVVKYINRDVIKYVETASNPDVCTLDADGLRLANDAISGKYTGQSDTGAVPSKVPGSSPNGKGN
jgi:hypothetical protein